MCCAQLPTSLRSLTAWPAVLLQMLGLYLILWVTLGLGMLYAAVHFTVFGRGMVGVGHVGLALLRPQHLTPCHAAGCSRQLRMLAQVCPRPPA